VTVPLEEGDPAYFVDVTSHVYVLAVSIKATWFTFIVNLVTWSLPSVNAVLPSSTI